VLEGRVSVDEAQSIAEVIAELPFRWAYKASFDKANRTSASSGRGPGLTEGIDLLAEIKEKLQVPIVTDVHLPEQCAPAAEVADILQIPAFLCRQTDLLLAAAATGRVVNIKKGQFLPPADVVRAATKITSAGNPNVMLTERGSFFGYGRLVVDMTGLPEMQASGYPVLLDATHAVQRPSGSDGTTGGDWTLAPLLLRAGAAAGYDGFFIETHPEPLRSPSDGPNMIPLHELRPVLEQMLAIQAAL
jgi:2-dehydro-3-deoxyphosphooctonate aldolase (KDO 8-P synthase)